MSGRKHHENTKLPKLNIHAGLGKSGSSAIQRFLTDNTSQLLINRTKNLGQNLEFCSNARVDGNGAVIDLHDVLGGDVEKSSKTIAELILRTIRDNPQITNFIWSNISLSTKHVLISRIIQKLYKICDINITIYLRHQADWLVSAYLQWGVKHKTYDGPIISFDRYISEVVRYPDYYNLISRWNKSVGPDRFHPRPYGTTEDVVTDFLCSIGIDTSIYIQENNHHYRTLDPAWLTIFRLYQGQRDGKSLPGPLFRAIEKYELSGKAYREVSPESTLPVGARWAELIATFEKENKAIEHDYGLVIGPAGRSPAHDATLPAPAVVIPPILDLLLAQERNINILEQKIKVLNKRLKLNLDRQSMKD